MKRDHPHPLLRPFRLVLLRITNAVDALPRPLDSPHAHASGADPDRLLVFGSGPVVGYGVLSHDLALPGQLARQISAGTGHGVDIDLVADPDLVVQTALDQLRQLDLWRYDSIVLSIGTNNSLLLTSPRTWSRHLTEILDYLEEATAANTGIYLVAIPPISSIDVHAGYVGRLAERSANRLNAETRRLAARSSTATFVPFSPLVRADFTRYRSAATYQQWASVIAAPLIRDLRRTDGATTSTAPSDELARQHALDAIGIVDSAAEERFDRIARLATQLFGADQTLIAFLDHERLWIKAASDLTSVTSVHLQRAGSFSDWAAREAPPFVVEDATRDPRFAQHPCVVDDEQHVRFFAGYPIESAFGERIGVLGVFAKEPRTWSESETKLLRDLALMVQRELTLD